MNQQKERDNLAKLLRFIFERDKMKNEMPFQKATKLIEDMKEFIERYSK